MNYPDPNSPTVGPSDSSDTGSDLAATDDNSGIEVSTDRSGTGERMSAEGDAVQEAADIGVDRVVSAEEAGLGGGLDQAEEAQLGITDEEIESFETRN